jgi:hypothetical protein
MADKARGLMPVGAGSDHKELSCGLATCTPVSNPSLARSRTPHGAIGVWTTAGPSTCTWARASVIAWIKSSPRLPFSILLCVAAVPASRAAGLR